MARKRNRQSEQFIRSALANTWDYTDYEDMLTEIALSRFEWDGLPDTCDERYLEKALFFNGKAVYCRDEVAGDLTLKVALGDRMGVYGIPNSWSACNNGYTLKCDTTNSVLIFNNYKMKPTYQVILNYAMRLYELDRTIDVNVGAQKTPVLILCDENERLSMENLYTQYEGNRPVIFGKKGLSLDNFEVLKTDAPYVSDKIYDLKVNIFNEALTVLGISNVSIEKRERLVSDEVSRAMGGTMANRMSYMSMREKAVDKINKMFGTNITIKFRADVEDGMVDEESLDEDEDKLESAMKMSALAKSKEKRG